MKRRILLIVPSVFMVVSCFQADVLAPIRSVGAPLHFSGEVLINDEVWIDRTVEDVPWVDSTESAATVLALETEPVIRVGVVYSELGATTIRIGGRDASDVFELRGGSATGDALASNLTNEVIATRIAGATPQIRISRADGTVLFSTTSPVHLISASGFVRIRRFTSDQSLYRGTAEVRFNSSRAAIVGVNQLPIEQYLSGVVPRELGPLAYPFLEAQKTQSVAARTFARRRMQFCGAARCGHGYHVVPTTSDQVYGGYRSSNGAANEFALSNQAISETRGIVATYNGALIEGLYSSTSGGFTANSEDVFTNALPYLRGVPDHERGQAMDHVPSLDVFQRHGNPTNLRNHANGDFEADWSIYHRWYVDWTVEEMRRVAGFIQTTTFIDPGAIYAIDVVSRSSSGRVLEMRFVTEKRGTLTARKDAVRSMLRYVTYNAAGAMVLNSLRSTLVHVVPIVDPKTDAIVGWEAWGGGWGHGTGMSQTGAVGMAEKGRTFDEILRHYYRGVVLEQRW